MCTDAQQLHPDAACLLHPEELALYEASKKGRQLALNRLTQLLARAPLDVEERMALDALVQKGMAGASACTVIKFQASGGGGGSSRPRGRPHSG